MEGHDTVPLRLPRRQLTCSSRRLRWLVRALAVTGLVCAPIAAVAVPALAATSTAPPGSRPAGQGALPRTPPTPPPVRSSVSVILTDLLQDGAISAGALIALLVPITWYGAARRRERHAQTTRPGNTAPRGSAPGDAQPSPDPLFDYFGPQPAAPEAAPPRRPAPRFQPRPALAGRSTLSQGLASAQPMLPAPPVLAESSQAGPVQASGVDSRAPGLSTPASPPRAAAPRAVTGPVAEATPDTWTSADRGYGAPAASEAGLGVTRGSASTVRRAPVSGSPPWGPAPRPTSELPWTGAPGPSGTGRPPGAPTATRAPTAPDTAARTGPGAGNHAAGSASGRADRELPRSSAPRSIFEPTAQPTEQPAGQDGRRQAADSASWPIYTWNPEGETA